jgi:hypothetical protein
MIEWYLILMVPYGITTMPEPYQEEELCQQVGEIYFSSSFRSYKCIPYSDDLFLLEELIEENN